MTINTVIDSLPVARPDGMAAGHRKRFRGDVSDPVNGRGFRISAGRWPGHPIILDRPFTALTRTTIQSNWDTIFPYSRHVPDSGFVSQPARLAQSQGHAWCTCIVRSITMSVRF
jgi:hypothetical protein